MTGDAGAAAASAQAASVKVVDGEVEADQVVMRHTTAAELVRSMTRSYRVESTHIRAVLAHVKDDRGVLEALLDPSVLQSSIRVEAEEAWTVEAFACELMGTSFHALTFSLRPNATGPFPATSALTSVPTGKLPRKVNSRSGPDLFATARLASYDTARQPTSVFDGTSLEEFLVDIPHLDGLAGVAGASSFRHVAAQVAGLTTTLGLPLFFVHAPVAVPADVGLPRGVTGPCLRFGVAFPSFDDSRRLTFGTRLVSLCCEEGYGLWQRAAGSGDGHDHWDPVVPRQAATNVEPTPAVGDAADPGHGQGSRRVGGQPLAVTCLGPERAGIAEAVLQVLDRAGAPLLGLSETWLDDIAIIHLLTRTPLHKRALKDMPTDVRADLALSRALGISEPVVDGRLEDYRALMTHGYENPTDPRLAALWLGWVTPATPEALCLTVKTLRSALDITAAGFDGVPGRRARSGHLNIGYLVCREEPGADRLRGRMRVAVDLDALGVTRDPHEVDPGGVRCEPDDGIDPRTGRRVSGSALGRFCSDVERLWRTSLSFALGTAHVELDVVWRESWLGRWTPLRAQPDENRW